MMNRSRLTLKRSLWVAALLTLGLPMSAWAQCVNNGIPYAGTLLATVRMDVPSQVTAGTWLGSATFTRDGGSAPIANCPPGSVVYAYATYTEGGGVIARPYSVIDGRQTYYLSAGIRDYAYAIEILDTGQVFSSSGTQVPYQGDLYPLNARFHLYAAKDNPTSLSTYGLDIGAVLIGPYGTPGNTRVGWHHRASVYLTQKASCSVLNNDLTITLPTISINNFPRPGYATNPVSGQDLLNISCSGPMTADIQITANHGTADLNGKPSVLKIENEGQGNNATGIGYVLSASNDNVLVDGEYVRLGSLQSGTNTLPIKAQYYRYGSTARPGIANSSASFVLRFN